MPAKPAFARRGRSLQPGQRSELTVINADGTGRQVIFTADEIIEAPNWMPDDKWLIFNAGGELWRMSPDGAKGPEKIDTGPLADLNNDHVLSPDGKLIYVSSDDSHIYVLPVEGGDRSGSRTRIRSGTITISTACRRTGRHWSIPA